jgi:prepilin-type N-terminal cleavage/methylation domain-containing protein
MCSSPRYDCRIAARLGGRHGERGFNLIEIMMSMSVATVMFMALTTLFVQQSEVMQNQNERIDLGRQARFSLDHMRADLTSLGSNTSPNTAIDPSVCPKPVPALRVLSLALDQSYVAAAELNPNVKPAALTLFGSLDVKARYRTASIEGDQVRLYDDGTLPASQEAWDETFSKDKYLHISGADGSQMFFAIDSGSQSSALVKVVGTIPRIAAGVTCGYQGLGTNYTVDVQNFVRYRVIADTRPGAPKSTTGAATQTLLVRENLDIDGLTVKGQLILAENAVDLQLYDMGMDIDPAADSVKMKVYPLTSDVVFEGGDGPLGTTTAARPESLRFLTVKLSLRGTWPVKRLVHKAREVAWQPLTTWLLAGENEGAHAVTTAATRVSLPTLVSRNL